MPGDSRKRSDTASVRRANAPPTGWRYALLATVLFLIPVGFALVGAALFHAGKAARLAAFMVAFVVGAIVAKALGRVIGLLRGKKP